MFWLMRPRPPASSGRGIARPPAKSAAHRLGHQSTVAEDPVFAAPAARRPARPCPVVPWAQSRREWLWVVRPSRKPDRTAGPVSAMDTRLPPVSAEDLRRFECGKACNEEGSTCCAYANLKKTMCSRCSWPSPYGVTKSLKLCVPCMHDGYPEHKRAYPDLWPPCECSKSLYWWDKQWPDRQFLLNMDSPLLKQVLPPPSHALPRAPPGNFPAIPANAPPPCPPTPAVPVTGLGLPARPDQQPQGAWDAWGDGHNTPAEAVGNAPGLHNTTDLDQQQHAQPGSSGIRNPPVGEPAGEASGVPLHGTLLRMLASLEGIERRLQSLEAQGLPRPSGPTWTGWHDRSGWQAWRDG